MKISFNEEIEKSTLISHMVLHCITKALNEQEFSEFVDRYNKQKTIDIKLTVDNIELPIETFVEHWQSQIDRMIKEEAINLIKDKFNDTHDLLHDLNKQITNQIIPDREDY